LQALLQQTGPLLTTSANHPGKTPAHTIEEAETYFGDKVDFYVNGGDLSGREASTVMRVVDDMVEVLREGSIKINEAGEIEA
jgi:tRNA A37 threonylcarbamoyladenosine synthetase subunit TsaC/SUA5/YrdC